MQRKGHAGKILFSPLPFTPSFLTPAGDEEPAAWGAQKGNSPLSPACATLLQTPTMLSRLAPAACPPRSPRSCDSLVWGGEGAGGSLGSVTVEMRGSELTFWGCRTEISFIQEDFLSINRPEAVCKHSAQ